MMTLVTPLPPPRHPHRININYISCAPPPSNRAAAATLGGLTIRPGRRQAVTTAALLPVYTVVPFVVILLGIAVLPLAAPRWWESNRNKLLVSIVLGLSAVGLSLVREPSALVHMAEEYASFIVLLAALYVISGGILMRGDLLATPRVNSTFLAIGSVLASFIGTTGASMLLVRALLQTNRERTRVRHTVIFFIFLVSNIGGMLTPLGDPPLFLGYLQGVPFGWTFRLWPHWIVMVAGVFFGIFLTMIPALELLRLRGGELGVRAPWQFFWATGALSSFLDNAPTYLTFLALGQGLGLAREVVDVPHTILAAISVGAVAMGANSYIGNAPNFMVKSIAEEQGVRMPSFFGYMLYNGVGLLPLFPLVK